MKIYQIKNGYRYNSDTIFLYNFIKNCNLKGEILDVGSGCGILGLLIKKEFVNLNIALLEIQKENIEIINKNLFENDIKCDIIHVDFSEFKSEKRFDFIISNPPFYVGNIKKSENLHKNISRYASNLECETFIKVANSHLKPNGSLIFCYDAKQIQKISVLLDKFKLNVTKMQFIYPKIDSYENINLKNFANLVIIEAKKSSKSFCKILEPIFVNSNGKYTKMAKEIFDKLGIQSFDFEK